MDTFNLFIEGLSPIRTHINGRLVEIHAFIKNDMLMSFNAFAGHSARKFKHVIEI